MVGGLDRYYQIARCLRDEDLRADRQFEFMQLDAEMSFADADDVLEAITEAVFSAAEAVNGERPAEPERIAWHDAMARFGSDKPDLRFGLELTELTSVFAATEFRAFQAPSVKGVRLPGEAATGRAPDSTALTDRAKQLGAAGLVWMRVGDGLDSPVAKFLSDAEKTAIVDGLRADRGDLLLVVAGVRRASQIVLGHLRNDLGRPAIDVGPLRFAWITEFPLFEGLDDDGNPIPGAPSVHDAPPRRPRSARVGRGRGTARDPIDGLRPGLQRMGARVGQRPDPPPRRQQRSSRCSSASTQSPGAVRDFSSTRSGSARRRTPASRSASTGSWRSSRARTTSAR